MTAPVYTVVNTANAEGIVNYASQKISTDSGTATTYTVTLGFQPRYIMWMQATDRIRLEWFDGMGTTQSIRTVANGTVTLDTSAFITVGTVALNTQTQFTIAAADIPASKDFYWIALG